MESLPYSGVPILVSILSRSMDWLHCPQPLEPAWSCSSWKHEAHSLPQQILRQLPTGDRWASALHQLFPWPLGQLITCFQGLPQTSPAPRSFPRLTQTHQTIPPLWISHCPALLGIILQVWPQQHGQLASSFYRPVKNHCLCSLSVLIPVN